MTFQRIRNMLKRLVPEALNIRPVWVTLDSGLKICIDSGTSIGLFNELFVTQTYAAAMTILPSYDVVVDLGANRGMFLLFVLHYLHKQGLKQPQFYCVEAAESNFLGLKRHIDANSLSDKVVTARGAACGKRSGFVDFYYSPRAHHIGVVLKKRSLTTRKIPVIDVGEFVTSARIDLLKLDIEGSEGEFLKEYPDILSRTQVLIGEFHLREIDYQECQLALKESGLSFHCQISRFEDRNCIDIYTRDASEV